MQVPVPLKKKKRFPQLSLADVKKGLWEGSGRRKASVISVTLLPLDVSFLLLPLTGTVSSSPWKLLKYWNHVSFFGLLKINTGLGTQLSGKALF